MNKNKGITLIALIITIIILLILAGITILSLTGENGLITRAKQARKNTFDAQELENAVLGSYEGTINSIIDGTREQIMVDKEEYEQLKSDIEQLKSQDTNLQENVLWENNDPSVAFAAQTVQISNITQYSRIKILYGNYIEGTTEVVEYKEGIFPVVKLGTFILLDREWLNTEESTIFYRDERWATIVQNGIEFGVGRASQYTSADNNRIIPLKIIGYK